MKSTLMTLAGMGVAAGVKWAMKNLKMTSKEAKGLVDRAHAGPKQTKELSEADMQSKLKEMFDSKTEVLKKDSKSLKEELTDVKKDKDVLKKVQKEIDEYGQTETTSQHVRQLLGQTMPGKAGKEVIASIKADKKFEADFDKAFPQHKGKHFEEKLKIKADAEKIPKKTEAQKKTETDNKSRLKEAKDAAAKYKKVRDYEKANPKVKESTEKFIEMATKQKPGEKFKPSFSELEAKYPQYKGEFERQAKKDYEDAIASKGSKYQSSGASNIIGELMSQRKKSLLK